MHCSRHLSAIRGYSAPAHRLQGNCPFAISHSGSTSAPAGGFCHCWLRGTSSGTRFVTTSPMNRGGHCVFRGRRFLALGQQFHCGPVISVAGRGNDGINSTPCLQLHIFMDFMNFREGSSRGSAASCLVGPEINNNNYPLTEKNV